MLPKITNHPTKTVELPITKKKVKIRPFLVKEEKVLLMVKEESDPQKVMEAVCDAIDSAAFDSIQSKKLPLPDVEHLFNQLRAFSKGETVDLAYRCRAPNKGDASTICGTVVKYEIDLAGIEPFNDPKHTNKIQIKGSSLVVTMKYPSFDSAIASSITAESDERVVYDAMVELIESVINTETGEVFDTFTKEEATVFMDDAPKSFFDDVIDLFFNRMPSLQHTVDFECPTCGNKAEIKLRGLTDFFSSASPRTQSARITRQTTR